MTWERSRQERVRAAAIAALFELALAYALVTGLAVQPTQAITERLRVFGILPPPPPKPKPPPPKPARKALRTPKKEGAASPANIRSTPTEVVAPPPRIVIPAPPPIVSAPLPGIGADPSQGAASIRGPGTGSGGEGNGTGSGRGGNGEGGGGGSPPRWIKGKIKNKDYPRSAGEAGIGGTAEVIFTVGIDGRARDCQVRHSSGNRDLDWTTCSLIEQRFRYKPALDGYGRPVESRLIETHEWVISPTDRPPDDDEP